MSAEKQLLAGFVYGEDSLDLNGHEVQSLIKLALEEDHVEEDKTSLAIFSEKNIAYATIFSREAGILCGAEITRRIFHEVDRDLKIETFAQDGSVLIPNKPVLQIQGKVRSILTAERAALNFIAPLSGIASRVHRIQSRLDRYGIKILDTRKTLPGWRALSKYAVRTGGGANHRFHLKDMGIIKDNHIAACGSIKKAIEKFQSRYPNTPFEVEVENEEALREAISAGAKHILLDNMTPRQISSAVQLARNLAADRMLTLEASGGYTEENIESILTTGIDYISMGSITSSIKPLDFSLDVLSDS